MNKLEITDAEIYWQVGWDDENIPSFGLEFFEEESEAQQYSESFFLTLAKLGSF